MDLSQSRIYIQGQNDRVKVVAKQPLSVWSQPGLGDVTVKTFKLHCLVVISCYPAFIQTGPHLAEIRNLEEENVWLQEWIHEELAHGEVWHKQYEALLERQARLGSLLQTKSSFKPLEKKTQALQEELEEAQEALRECQNRSRQRQLHIHKREKENQRMAETVKELEKKRHLSEWEAMWQAKNDRIRQKQHQIEKLNTTIQGLSLRSQLPPASISPGCLEPAVGSSQNLAASVPVDFDLPLPSQLVH
ncbi:hypothetical protein JRQ81_002919 [Phrynocephalus forsythii]|uniref:Uncharacterized protein n=1 Tax=Phrynocephalus forsythii TaxID=171643 RepID=A0A9Q1AWF0_9SAUR|nr:hypothetical protein JRQ81_002919 [Phrynocephalus forsythii]